MSYTSGKQTVSMLTDNGDGSINVRLSPSSALPPIVKLREPTAFEYATLRSKMRAVDDEVEQAVSYPTPPTIPDGISDGEATAIVTQYAAEQQKAINDRSDYVRDPEKAPYALVLIDVIEKLTNHTVRLDDLPVEAFNASTCGALLEVWEAPLGGQAEAATPVEAAPVPEPPNPPAPTEPDSPEPEQS